MGSEMPIHDRHRFLISSHETSAAAQQSTGLTATQTACLHAMSKAGCSPLTSSEPDTVQPALTSQHHTTVPASENLSAPVLIPTRFLVYQPEPTTVPSATQEASRVPNLATSRDVSMAHHAETPPWLLAQLSQLKQHYRVASLEHGKSTPDLIGQRVAVVLLEHFEQRDQAGAMDILSIGIHIGQ